MRARGPARHLPIFIAVLLVLLLAVLAALQWRWVGEVSAMERQRMQASLATAAGRFVEDFDREVMQVFLAFHPDLSQPPEERLERVVRQYERWQAEAQYPGLVRDVFLIRRGEGGEPELAVLRPRERRFEPCPWPPELARLHQHLTEVSHALAGHREVRGMPLGVFGEVPGLLIPLVFLEGPDADQAGSRLAGAHLLARLDLPTISGEIFPALTRRFFLDEQGGDYALAVKDLSTPGRVVFLSDPGVPVAAFGAGDLSMDMLRPWPFEIGRAHV